MIFVYALSLHSHVSSKYCPERASLGQGCSALPYNIFHTASLHPVRTSYRLPPDYQTAATQEPRDLTLEPTTQESLMI